MHDFVVFDAGTKKLCRQNPLLTWCALARMLCVLRAERIRLV